jgi:lipoprotein-releasing system permease protein
MDDRLQQALDQNNNITHYQTVANKAGIIKTEEAIQGVVMKGVGEDYDWNYFCGCLKEGVVPQYVDGERSNDVLLSKNIADKMLLSVGDPVRVWFIDEDMQARGRKFSVSGIFETGLSEFDERYVFCDLDQIRKLNHWEDNQVGVVEVWIDDIDNMQEINDQLYFGIPPTLASYTARESNPQIFDWLDLLDTNVWLILVLMFLVAGITVISMLLIIIIEKTSTIGLLKAMGASDRFVRKVFLYRSIRILLIGMIIGNIVGLSFCLLQYYTGLVQLNPETYYLSAVPVEMRFSTVVILNFAVFILWLLMLLIPTSIINRIRPAKSIRFE